MTITVAPCTHQAAKFAVENWHYSKRLPVGKTVRLGVWENDEFTGAVLFSWGANKNLAASFGLSMTQCVELVRVALRPHDAFVTQAVACALRIVQRDNPGLRVCVSFADPSQGHVGLIYQAGNWLYLGRTPRKRDLLSADGVTLNRRAFTGRQFGTGARSVIPPGARWVEREGKHRYAMPFDRAMRRQLQRIAQPYPSST